MIDEINKYWFCFDCKIGWYNIKDNLIKCPYCNSLLIGMFTGKKTWNIDKK